MLRHVYLIGCLGLNARNEKGNFIMAIAITPSAGLVAVDKPTRPSFLRRTFDRFVAARELQAQRYVNGYLLTLDDKTLDELGYKRAELEANEAHPFPY